MPTPVAHTLAGAALAVVASRRLRGARALPVVAAVLFAANLPDVDYLALVRGRQAMELFHQGPCHSAVFVALATLPIALLVRRHIGVGRSWPLLAGAGLTHLALDLVTADRKPPIGFPIFWPLSDRRYHLTLEVFPGIDRVDILSRRNLHEFVVEVAWCVPALLVAAWLTRPRGENRSDGPSIGDPAR